MAVTTNKRRSAWILLALLLSAAVAWLSAPSVSAHAAYESSSPEFAQVLSQSPSEISIRFTQELFRREGANAITLTHVGSGTDVPVEEPAIDNDDRTRDDGLQSTRICSRAATSSHGRICPPKTETPIPGRTPSTSPAIRPQRRSRRIAKQQLTYSPSTREMTSQNPTRRRPSSGRRPSRTRNRPTPPRSEQGRSPGWVVGIVAALVLVGALGFHLGSRRRGA